MKERLQKTFNSWIGAVIYLAIGLAILVFLMQTSRIELYILVIAGVPIIYLLHKQDWLPYIFGGVALALVAHMLLSLTFSTDFPVVAVVSGSMEHDVNAFGYPCNNRLSNYQNTFDQWWQACSSTYQPFNVTKEQFAQFPYSNGLNIGDMPIVQNAGAYKVGDIIVYDAGQAAPIIHRIVAINSDGTYQTKGDHNMSQNSYEHSVNSSQIAGKVVFVIPYLGYFKVITSQVFGI